jgi:hypothetical protein
MSYSSGFCDRKGWWSSLLRVGEILVHGNAHQRFQLLHRPTFGIVDVRTDAQLRVMPGRVIFRRHFQPVMPQHNAFQRPVELVQAGIGCRRLHRVALDETAKSNHFDTSDVIAALHFEQGQKAIASMSAGSASSQADA